MNVKELLNTIQRDFPNRQILVLADERLRMIGYGLPVTGDGIPVMEIKASEENKSLTAAEQIWTWLTANGATRQAILVNLGGGVICDLGGFAAATYLRGIDYINIPTTLLAMVDAAVGGKTGVNLHGLKNRIGAFRQPLNVIIEPAFLDTLHANELLSGYGEMIKTALLIGEKSFERCLEILNDMSSITETLPRRYRDAMIDECRAYKEKIVGQDPEEKDLRKVLNFGHTVGHALEEKTGALHGYCALWGLVAEMYISVVKLGCPKKILQQLTQVMIEYYGRPQCNCKEQNELIDLMRKDKKNSTEDAINFTLIRKAGDPIINQVADRSIIEEALDYLFSL